MITDDQKKAFGFSGKNLTFLEVVKFLQQMQDGLMLQAVAQTTKGEDRIHFCGQADAINCALLSLLELRREARVLNGLTPEEDLV